VSKLFRVCRISIVIVSARVTNCATTLALSRATRGNRTFNIVNFLRRSSGVSSLVACHGEHQKRNVVRDAEKANHCRTFVITHNEQSPAY
jgi:hypothetical protein